MGGQAPIPDRVTAGILSHVIDNLPDVPILSALREGQCAIVGRASRAVLSPGTICGLTAWTIASADVPREGRTIPLHWDSRGLGRSDTPAAGTLVPDPPYGEATTRVLRLGQHLAGDGPVGTLEFLAAAFSADSADWPGLAAASGIGKPSAPGQVDEATGGIVTADLGRSVITITTALAKALRFGQRSADYLNHETMVPAHVILAAVSDDETAAARWLGSHKHPMPDTWIRLLGDRMLSADLSAPDLTIWPEETLAAHPSHEDRMTSTALSQPVMLKGTRKWLAPAVVTTILLLLPATMNLGYTLQTWISGRGELGLVLGASTRPGALVKTVLPDSPAARAGLHIGDLIVAVTGTPVTTAEAAVLAIRATLREHGSPSRSCTTGSA